MARIRDEAVPISYRPFDTRYTYYTGNSKGFHCRARVEVMQHFYNDDENIRENIGLMLCKQFKSFQHYQHVFITKNMFESSLVSNKTSEISYGFPLYLYPDTRQQHIEQERIPNLEQTIVESIENSLGLRFTPEKQEDNVSFAPVNILDYIYAVLHSPSYRERYKEFLKTDFPKVPYPTDKELFWKLVKLGGELRSLHLMESPALEQLFTGYNIPGSNKVEKINYEGEESNAPAGNVHINDTQYFEGVPKIAWDFYIGGYKPAQKWLKDRIGRKLTPDDVKHYQKIVVTLMNTADIMSEIDKLPNILQDDSN